MRFGRPPIQEKLAAAKSNAYFHHGELGTVFEVRLVITGNLNRNRWHELDQRHY